jgi:hypothetical protein
LYRFQIFVGSGMLALFMTHLLFPLGLPEAYIVGVGHVSWERFGRMLWASLIALTVVLYAAGSLVLRSVRADRRFAVAFGYFAAGLLSQLVRQLLL